MNAGILAHVPVTKYARTWLAHISVESQFQVNSTNAARCYHNFLYSFTSAIAKLYARNSSIKIRCWKNTISLFHF